MIDVFGADPSFGKPSSDALRRCRAEGSLVACEVVWAEVAGGFPTETAAQDALGRLGVRFSPLDAEAALLAGRSWRAYHGRGGQRERLIPDFLIGAHGASAADRLLTRDRGFYRQCFDELPLIDPSVS